MRDGWYITGDIAALDSVSGIVLSNSTGTHLDLADVPSGSYDLPNLSGNAPAGSGLALNAENATFQQTTATSFLGTISGTNSDATLIKAGPGVLTLSGANTFVTAIGAGTTYPDYKPAPFIVSSEVEGVDMVTVVTEGIFSYCGVKLKIDTDRHLGPEQNTVRAEGEPVGHVTTGEYGSQMLSLGGVRHLTGGGKKEGRVTCETLLDLCNGKPVELTVDEGASVVVQAGQPPIVNGVKEERMRVGCGSATIGMFARQWFGKVDEVVVVDDHITGVLSEHYAGRYLGVGETGMGAAPGS
jgi:hypothetical protein